MRKAIKGYESYYEISDDGKVFSCERRAKTKNSVGRLVKYRELKQGLSGTGYFLVGLSKNCKTKSFNVHQLVAFHFIDNPKNKSEINHKDGNKQNNNVENLEWTTRLENVQHAVQNELKPNMKGKNNPLFRPEVRRKFLGQVHPMAKLTNAIVLEIRKSDLSNVELAKIYNISRQMIGNIRRRQNWSHI